MTAHPDTRALARLLLAIAVSTVALLIVTVALVGVSRPATAGPSPVNPTATAH
jgi:hypothetical protein